MSGLSQLTRSPQQCHLKSRILAAEKSLDPLRVDFFKNLWSQRYPDRSTSSRTASAFRLSSKWVFFNAAQG
jgi:hypothetical protein